jgi:hypothetical protein
MYEVFVGFIELHNYKRVGAKGIKYATSSVGTITKQVVQLDAGKHSVHTFLIHISAFKPVQRNISSLENI